MGRNPGLSALQQRGLHRISGRFILQRDQRHRPAVAIGVRAEPKQRDVPSGHQRLQRGLALVRRLDAGEPHLAAVGEQQRPAVDDAFDLSVAERLAGAGGVVGRPCRHDMQQGKPAGERHARAH